MGDAKIMHVLQTIKDLTSVLLDKRHRYEVFAPVHLLDDIFEILLTIFKHGVLDDPLLGIDGIEEVQKLDNIVLAPEHVENFKFSGNDVASLLGPLQSNFALPVLTVSLKHKAYRKYC